MPVDPFDPSDFGFPEGSAIFDYPSDKRKQINEARMRIQGAQAYVQFWEGVLTPSEKESLGNDMEACYQANPININLLCRLRNWTPERAVIEIAHELEFLTDKRYEKLCREVGANGLANSPSEAGTRSTPCWNLATGRLEFNGQLCRELNVRAATLIVPVLNAFESQGWPESIQSPVDSSIERQRIHDTVSNLNRSLEHIRFHVQGDSIIWRECQ